MESAADHYFQQVDKWQVEQSALRALVISCGLTETLKWRQPCYTFEGANIVIIGSFKASCTLSFFKGALLKDPEGILELPGENTQAARVIRFTILDQITSLGPAIKAYIAEAIKVEQAGLKVETKPNTELEIPEELTAKYASMPQLKTAFEALTPGRQRAYVMFFNAAKQAKTRDDRIEKYIPRIIDGKGMNDCTCGLSKRMPGCDGSHKQLLS